MPETNQSRKDALLEIASVFLRLGIFAFGGPAAHIAMMDDEVVKKRKWLTREHFVDLIGATNLIPGPNSTELAIHLGMERAGVPGLFVAGACFILPAMLIVMAVAALYAKYGVLPQVDSIMYGVKPVIIAIIALAVVRLWKTAVKGWPGILAAVAVIAGSLAGLSEIPMLFATGALYTLWSNRGHIKNGGPILPSVLPMFALSLPLQSETRLAMGASGLFLTFLKIGSVLYGSGYVLVAFLETEFVQRAILTQKQLLDAVAVGQFTPGPVFTTATFIGYLISGVPGALTSTLGIFLPAFLLVWLLNPVIPKLRASKWAAAALNGINAASLGLMAAVVFKLAISTLDGLLPIAIFALSLGVLWKFKLNSAFVIIAGGLIGWLASLI